MSPAGYVVVHNKTTHYFHSGLIAVRYIFAAMTYIGIIPFYS